MVENQDLLGGPPARGKKVERGSRKREDNRNCSGKGIENDDKQAFDPGKRVPHRESKKKMLTRRGHAPKTGDHLAKRTYVFRKKVSLSITRIKNSPFLVRWDGEDERKRTEGAGS